MVRNIWRVYLFLCFIPLFAGDLPLGENESATWSSHLRQRTLIEVDELFSVCFPFSMRTFSIQTDRPAYMQSGAKGSLQRFSQNHGYFSCDRPLVGIVTEEEIDTWKVEAAFDSLYEFSDPFFVCLARGEILTKALAYRNLHKGLVITLPTLDRRRIVKVDYVIDEVLDLWMGIPAFGLISLHGKAKPILLFRGTDFSLLSKNSFGSILSDLDVSGVGLSTFYAAHSQIHSWLVRAYEFTRKKAEVMGFSLGGALALYTVFFEKEYVSSSGSMAFNAPGFSKVLLDQFPGAFCPEISLYLTSGDIVSKLGKLVAPAFSLINSEELAPIDAHTRLMSAEMTFSFQKILLDEENKNRLFIP